MARLSSEQVLKDKQTRNPDAITALSLNHKSLTDVSCLSEFKNLERLDLAFNNLTSLEGLKACTSLKWLSVAQNKLESLKGVEGLSKLTVLNAGKNKLKSMDEISSIVSLRALILNDNEITSICKLSQMKELNTLVLSRNPVRQIGDSVAKMKSITKLSLSNCQLQTIDSSLKSCTELKELRLAHNDIKTLPAELVQNAKLQNLDLGNNLITKWSDLKVLKSLVNLKNLNLQGNPVAEKDNLAGKIKKLLPNLQIFNARPIDKYTKSEKGDGAVTGNDHSEATDNHPVSEEKDGILDMEDDSTRKRKKTKDKHSKKEVSAHEDNDSKPKKKPKAEQGEPDIIDNVFMELFTGETREENPKTKALKDQKEEVAGLVTFPAKKKKTKSHSSGASALKLLSEPVEVGMGGPSSWD